MLVRFYSQIFVLWLLVDEPNIKWYICKCACYAWCSCSCEIRTMSSRLSILKLLIFVQIALQSIITILKFLNLKPKTVQNLYERLWKKSFPKKQFISRLYIHIAHILLRIKVMVILPRIKVTVILVVVALITELGQGDVSNILTLPYLGQIMVSNTKLRNELKWHQTVFQKVCVSSKSWFIITDRLVLSHSFGWGNGTLLALKQPLFIRLLYHIYRIWHIYLVNRRVATYQQSPVS